MRAVMYFREQKENKFNHKDSTVKQLMGIIKRLMHEQQEMFKQYTVVYVWRNWQHFRFNLLPLAAINNEQFFNQD